MRGRRSKAGQWRLCLPVLSDHVEKFVLADDTYAQLVGLVEFGRSHVVASEDEVGLAGYAADVAASVVLDDLFVFLATMMVKDTADDDGLSCQDVGLRSLRGLFLKVDAGFAQAAQDIEIALFVELVDDAFRNCLADTVDRHEFF